MYCTRVTIREEVDYYKLYAHLYEVVPDRPDVVLSTRMVSYPKHDLPYTESGWLTSLHVLALFAESETLDMTKDLPGDPLF